MPGLAMTMIRTNTKSLLNRLMWALVLAGQMLLAGCFDAKVVLELTPKGAGSLEVRVDLPANMAGKITVSSLDSLIQPFPQYQLQKPPGRVVLSEKTKFAWLEDVVARRMRFKIENIGTGVLGMGSYTYRVWAWLHAPEGDLPNRFKRPGTQLETTATRPPQSDPAAERARRLLSRTWGHRAISLVLKLPGRISEAQAVTIGAYRINPQVTLDESTVIWRAPVSELIKNRVRATQVFRADFKGSFAFRVPTQSESLSRLPKKEELEAWVEERKKRGM